MIRVFFLFYNKYQENFNPNSTETEAIGTVLKSLIFIVHYRATKKLVSCNSVKIIIPNY